MSSSQQERGAGKELSEGANDDDATPREEQDDEEEEEEQQDEGQEDGSTSPCHALQVRQRIAS